VFFFDPLKPDFPAEDQEITCPFLLVIDTMILLNEACM